jgi:hypothetical protein
LEIQMAKIEKRRFQYQKRDPNVVKERANQRGGDFDSMFKSGVKMFKPRDGKNMIRILPPTWDGNDHYGYEIWCNYGIGVDDQSYLSLSKMKNEKDPLAEARKLAERKGDHKLADSLTPKKRVLMYIIDRNNEEEGPQLWSAPWTVDKDFCNISYDEDTREVIMVDDPEEGCDIRFYKEGTGKTTKYDAAKMRLMKPSRLHEDEGLMDEWLAHVQANPLPNCLNFYDYDHIASVYEGHVVKSDDEDEPKPPPNGKKPVVDEDHDEDGVVIEIPRKPKPTTTPDEDEDVPAMSPTSIRERLMARRAKPPVDDDD